MLEHQLLLFQPNTLYIGIIGITAVINMDYFGIAVDFIEFQGIKCLLEGYAYP